ncbi:DISARM system phospholipase D-like protein DrmC [Bifidobacterium leontopitheci]|uniref:Phospholipase n=1 Tax=Bifidobacterium leontopitheci TaxID=2650774 RepID=A0A6I1GES6_9BIFI|nr:DISARM system phospholipase D-like protein DrmC [Bifidobacterium leontopitheci]KAB7790045.1 phospholipase [Bifidobacterium leontopitheci]
MDEQQQDALIALGAYLTGTEAEEMANRLEAGETLSQVLGVTQASRRAPIRKLFKAAGYGAGDEQRQLTVASLRGIQGAHSNVAGISPVWTAPHLLASVGDLNSSRSRLVKDARVSIVCSTYNFQASSDLWKALTDMDAEHPEVTMRIYVDSSANDGKTTAGSKSLSPEEIARGLPRASVFRTKEYQQGRCYRNHAKFLAIDHELLLVTSANFSYSAENLNIELGLKAENRNLTEMVENEMRHLETHVYEQV